METRANYALIGLFTLAVIFGAFGFVYWFTSGGQQATRKDYVVHFSGSVSGLSNGGSVLFNGLKVGEVTELGLMQKNPGQVYAKISVDARTPIKSDTTAKLEYGGLTGVASVSLLGGSASAPALPEGGVINAAPSELQDLLQMAQKLSVKADGFLDRANKLIDQNSSSFKSSLDHINTLTGNLADSSANLKATINAVDPAKVRAIINNADQSMAKVNALLGTGQGKTMIADISKAARSIKKLSDSLTKFANTGLKQYQGLAVQGRKTLQEIDRTAKMLRRDPQSIIFGPKPELPVYNGR